MYYLNQTIILATKHQKQKAIEAPFEKKLGCHLTVHEFDTDKFGTFTGEIERLAGPYETCLLKAKTALQSSRYHLALASEGSFGPHPSIPFAPMAHEIMLFVDNENDWIISEQIFSQNTNYASLILDKHSRIEAFLKQVGFPSHALTLQSYPDKKVIAKGILDLETLQRYIHQGLMQYPQLLLATDMRAMMNPTRMSVLAELADKLALRIFSLCPQCQAPGFGIYNTEGALPCLDCGGPSSLYQHEVWGCIECSYQEIRNRHDGLIYSEPRFCYGCNP